MADFAIFWEWLAFAVRWLHVITAIAWIGSSFYFVALDLGLRKRPDLPQGVHGEEWQVHGGGFYHVQKYLVAPSAMPEHLTWFKWESYATWLSGFALLAVVYYAGADLFLIDSTVRNLSPTAAILISAASLGLGWLLYDLMCKSQLGRSDTLLMLALFVVIVGMALFYTSVFSGRAALLHLGAFTATIMSANVFLLIIPNQKIVVADLLAGRQPDPRLGRAAKQRSLHNNYLTLPVLFLMLSNHYPLAFATPFNWLIAVLVFPIGALIRHYFNTRHAGMGNPHWALMVAGVLFLVIVWLSTAPAALTGERAEAPASRQAAALLASTHFPAVRDTVMGRCSMCHAAEPGWEGIFRAPKGVQLDTDEKIANHAREIYLQAGVSHAMPPGNRTGVTEQERRLLAAWYEGRGQ
ncbi:MAG TPA: urate hydroxylase PuuD [Mesorhizobium sp.]|jgi:uncharacterized membrane protein|nr:urate hydroxylase PuuD [Mesorhizobium sp.]